jgi:hypothetical protein
VAAPVAVVNMLVGAVTPGGATFVATVDGGGPVRVQVADNEAMSGAVFTASEPVDAQGVAKVSITGLASSTRFFWRVEDNAVVDTDPTGQFVTYPPVGAAASFTFAAASCAGLDPDFPGVAGGELDATLVSNHPVHDTIRTQAAGWLGFVHLGDWGYPDWGVTLTDTVANRRSFLDDNLAQPRQGQLWRELPLTWLPDDHDFLANNLRGPSANFAQVYRERLAHYDLLDAAGVWQDWQIGRVLFVGADVRSHGSANGDPDTASKTMLGAAQKARLGNLLATSQAKLLVWMLPQQWLGTAADSWASFQTEQAELVALFQSTGWAGRMCIVSGDYHGLAIDSGANSPGNIPVLQAASLDATPGLGTGGIYSAGNLDGRGQYGTVAVQDLGTHLLVTLTAWRGTSTVFTHTFTVAGDPPTRPATGALHRTLPGSHRMLAEARVLTTFQTGDTPAGVQVDILDGDVVLDGTAEVQRSLVLATTGTWPRRAGDLLAPYGNEIFVRRGLDLGPDVEPLWFPLGYFRIDTPEQDRVPDGPIRLSCQDRMAGIVDGELLAPRELAATRTNQSVFDELVGEIYPDATVIFDGLASETLGRPLVAERSRYRILRDIADSLGKIMYWDGEGFLRVEDAPDPGDPVWDVYAGPGGVQVGLSRTLTRRGVYNAVVATGEGGDSGDPVRAVAIDANPLSPTCFGGRFGRVPKFYASPLLTTAGQAATAAAAMLRRLVGLPYQVDFQAVVNPALRPHDPIRIRDKAGNRELHIVERLTIPLIAGASMSGTTREQTLVNVQV